MAKSQSWVARHSLSLTLLGLMFTMTVFLFISGMYVFEDEQQAHGEQFVWPDFLLWWAHEYHLSLVADVFGAFLLVTLKIRLREEGSPEAKD